MLGMTDAQKLAKRLLGSEGKMHVLWIVGNGFDLNLGLETSYKSFREEVYFKEDRFKADREKLQKLGENLGGKGASSFESGDPLWSDLEVLLGKSTIMFNGEDIEEFHGIFERMQEALRNYLISEQDRFKELPDRDKLIEEFWGSVSNFEDRMLALDKNQLGTIQHRNENVHYHFVSLNYTSCFDEMLKEASRIHRPFARNGNYIRDISDVLHIHGTLDEYGAIVFGVSDPDQIANPEFAENDEFTELWVKGKKSVLYRNDKNLQLIKLIKEAKYVVVFGASMGLTDLYIWRMIGEHVARTEDARFVLFERSIELPGVIWARKTQRSRIETLAKVADLFGWDDQEINEARDRLLFLPSKMIFRFSSDDGLGAGRVLEAS